MPRCSLGMTTASHQAQACHSEPQARNLALKTIGGDITMRTTKRLFGRSLLKGGLTLAFAGLVLSWAQWQAISLHPTGWQSSEANAIDGGQAAGGGTLPDGSQSAVLWNSLNAASATALNDSSQTVGSWAFDLSNGVAVGPAWSTTVHAGAWNPTYIDLNPSFTAWSNAFSVAHPMWAQSFVTAGIALYGSVFHAVVWASPNSSSLIDLHPANAGQSFAFGINDNGAVTGSVDGQAAYWSDYRNAATSYVNIHPAGTSYSVGLGITETGLIGGFAVTDHERAWIWDMASSTPADIHPSGADGDSEVLGIYTDSLTGQTLAVGFATFNGEQHAVVWRCLDPNSYTDLHAFLPGTYEFSWARGVWRDGDGTWYVSGAAGNGNTSEAYLWVLRLGDTNGDGCIDDNDLLAVLLDYGNTGCALPTDLNGDGVVDDNDVLIVLFNYGNGC